MIEIVNKEYIDNNEYECEFDDTLDIRKLAKEQEIPQLPENFLCDSYSCDQETEAMLNIAGVPNAHSRVTNFIKEQANEIVKQKMEIVERQNELDYRQSTLKDLLFLMGYERINWDGNQLSAIKDGVLYSFN